MWKFLEDAQFWALWVNFNNEVNQESSQYDFFFLQLIKNFELKLRIFWDMAFLFDNNYERDLADLFDFLQCTSTRLGRIQNSCESF